MIKGGVEVQEARYYEQLDADYVRCCLCPHSCKIGPGRLGFCRARRNTAGVLYTLNYGQVTSFGVDPVEKKPLYHFFPGSQILSVGTFGCNFRCGFCQNWEIAHGRPAVQEVTPEALVELALKAREQSGSIGIAYTYSEPLIWYEFVYDTAVLAREEGLKNVLVTNGYIQQEPLAELLPLIDALNIDVKGFTDDYYREVCSGRLEPVLQTVESAYKAGCHLELTNLLVTGMNDSEEDVSALVDWIASLDPAIPLHLSRYFPQYRFELPPTPPERMSRAREVARSRLRYVYVGNLWDAENDTLCPQCHNLLIRRTGYGVELRGLKGDRCSRCGSKAEVVVTP